MEGPTAYRTRQLDALLQAHVPNRQTTSGIVAETQ
jgi:hypothetical protein